MAEITGHPLYRIHTIDSAMNSLWEFYKKKFPVLFIISLIVSLITQYISTRINFAELQTITDPQEMLLRMKDYVVPMLLITALNLLFTTVLHYYVIYNPLSPENTPVRCSINSLRYLIPYLVIIILLAFFGSVLLVLGLAALIVGAFLAALYIITIYMFILPVMMVEGPNIGNTITRTIRLSHRNFWSNAGWTAVFLVIIIVISVIFSGLILLPFTGSFMKVFSSPEEVASIPELASNPAYIILTSVVNAFVFPLLPVFASILYFNSRAREDQAAGEEKYNGHDNKVRVEDLYAKPLPEEDPEKTNTGRRDQWE
ncbi:MAG: hypothetical protein GYA41_02410 [Bacteroidales bacterium]|nr:hypothetical protein [Bacteroidales bacterium]